MKESDSISAPLPGLLSLSIAAAASWMAVSNQPGPETLLIAGVGLLYLIAPPPGSIPRSILILFGLACLVALMTFLPLAGHGDPVRRSILDHGIALPPTLSAQPWWTLEDLLLLLTSLLWAWNCFEVRFSVSQRKFLVTSFLLVSAVAAVSLLGRGAPWGENLPPWSLKIGQFENRNQTGDLLLLAGLFSFARGFSDMLNRKSRGFFWFGVTGLFTAAIIQNGSRAALVLFGIGLIFLFVRMGKLRPHGVASWLVLLAFAMAGATLFYYQGASLQGRFYGLWESLQVGRIPIYRDAWSMILKNPWLGVGLGNFEGLFNLQRYYSGGGGARCLHPESDWLWLGSELGLGGMIVFGLLVFFAFRIYLGPSPFPALTQAGLIASAMFLLHTFFDVGGHRIGAAWTCLYLVGLASFRPASTVICKVPRLLLRLAGFCLLIVAALRLQSAGTQPWMPTRGSVDAIEERLDGGLPSAEKETLLGRAVAWSPLEPRLYFQRGVLLEYDGRLSAARNDFSLSLFLDRSSVKLPDTVGEVCSRSDFVEAMAAWQEALRRTSYMRPALLADIYSNPDLDAGRRLQLATLAGDDPDLEIIAVVNQAPANFDWSCQNFLTANPSLAGVDPALARQLFDRWAEAGDAGKLADEFPEHPEWEAAGWRAHARALARIGLFDAAVRAALNELPPPRLPGTTPPAVQDAWREYLEQQDSFSGIELYLAQSAAGKSDDALKTLQSVAQLPNAPPFVSYLLARDLLAAGQNQAAWNTIQPLLDSP